MRKIYLASSWRNPNQPQAVQMLRDAGHLVYDFRHPMPENSGFSWGDIAEGLLNWSPEEYLAGLQHPIANAGYKSDKDALDWADTGVLLLPCNRSAHLEAGYMIGQGKPVLIVLDEQGFEPELMYKLADNVVPSLEKMLQGVADLREYSRPAWAKRAVQEQKRADAAEDQSRLLAERVTAMRDAQKDYFRTRHQESLTKSKKLEREVDDMLKIKASGGPLQEQGRLA